MKIKYIALLALAFLFLFSTLEAKTFTFSQIHKMPKSVEKDYYIWRFLSQASTTSSQATAIIKEANYINKKLRKSYRKKTGKVAPKVSTPKETLPEHIWKGRSRGNKNFKKGLAMLRKKKPKLAASYFDVARRSYIKRHQIDKALFWLYLSTKNDIYLEHLGQSYSPNMYTLLAADIKKISYPKTITERFKKSKTKGFDIQNPIEWAKIKEKMFKSNNRQLESLANDYASQECVGIYTYLKAKACEYTKQYFPMPYRDIMKQFPVKRQALIYAIARQESRFVPASVSRSFALGMMQFMPFLVKHIAKEKGYKMDLDEMFNPYRSIEFADYHLDYLTKHLHHPLFIAYAYNAGIGFTRKHLRKAKNFRNGTYEPYMSMESMKNHEAKEYGKKVLANYVVYLNKLGVPTRMTSLVKILADPSKTDKYRK